MLPYLSSISVNLNGNHANKGHTKGLIAGMSAYRSNFLYTLYAGYEDSKLQGGFYTLDTDSYYVGAQAYIPLKTYNENRESFAKLQAGINISKAFLERQESFGNANARPVMYDNSLGGDLGMNFKQGKHTFNPDFGVWH